MVIKILKIIIVSATLTVAFVLAILFLLILLSLINSKISNDFIDGKTGEIKKILFKKGNDELIIEDNDLMKYLEKTFKNLKSHNSELGERVSIFIYYKYRPPIYGEFFFGGVNSKKGHIWVDGNESKSFEFEFEMPQPKEFIKLINFIKSKEIKFNK
jgi:hypothetical protein